MSLMDVISCSLLVIMIFLFVVFSVLFKKKNLIKFNNENIFPCIIIILISFSFFLLRQCEPLIPLFNKYVEIITLIISATYILGIIKLFLIKTHESKIQYLLATRNIFIFLIISIIACFNLSNQTYQSIFSMYFTLCLVLSTLLVSFKNDIENKIDYNSLDQNQFYVFNKIKHLIENTNHKSILIDGDYGTGKTYVMNAVMHDLIDENSKDYFIHIDTKGLQKLQLEQIIDNHFTNILKKERGFVSFDKRSMNIIKNITKLFNTSYADELLFSYSNDINRFTEINKVLNTLLKDKQIIIIIDDLERCKISDVKEYIYLIKQLSNFDKVKTFYLLNFEEIVKKEIILKEYEKEEEVYKFYDKFFDYQIKLMQSSVSIYNSILFDNLSFRHTDNSFKEIYYSNLDRLSEINVEENPLLHNSDRDIFIEDYKKFISLARNVKNIASRYNSYISMLKKHIYDSYCLNYDSIEDEIAKYNIQMILFSISYVEYRYSEQFSRLIYGELDYDYLDWKIQLLLKHEYQDIVEILKNIYNNKYTNLLISEDVHKSSIEAINNINSLINDEWNNKLAMMLLGHDGFKDINRSGLFMKIYNSSYFTLDKFFSMYDNKYIYNLKYTYLHLISKKQFINKEINCNSYLNLTFEQIVDSYSKHKRYNELRNSIFISKNVKDKIISLLEYEKIKYNKDNSVKKLYNTYFKKLKKKSKYTFNKNKIFLKDLKFFFNNVEIDKVQN